MPLGGWEFQEQIQRRCLWVEIVRWMILVLIWRHFGGFFEYLGIPSLFIPNCSVCCYVVVRVSAQQHFFQFQWHLLFYLLRSPILLAIISYFKTECSLFNEKINLNLSALADRLDLLVLRALIQFVISPLKWSAWNEDLPGTLLRCSDLILICSSQPSTVASCWQQTSVSSFPCPFCRRNSMSTNRVTWVQFMTVCAAS